MSKEDSALAAAYAAKRKPKGYKGGDKVGCMDCMSMGGKCMAHGGGVSNEKMNPGREVEMPEDMERDEALEYDEGDDESDKAKLAQGGYVQKEVRQSRLEEMGAEGHKTGSLLDSIMEDRKNQKLADGGLVDEPVEDDFEKRVNLEPVHTREDEEHDIESPSLDDESLVGQILKERKMRRRG